MNNIGESKIVMTRVYINCGLMADTLRITDVTERFFSFSCVSATFAVAAGEKKKKKRL